MSTLTWTVEEVSDGTEYYADAPDQLVHAFVYAPLGDPCDDYPVTWQVTDATGGAESRNDPVLAEGSHTTVEGAKAEAEGVIAGFITHVRKGSTMSDPVGKRARYLVVFDRELKDEDNAKGHKGQGTRAVAMLNQQLEMAGIPGRFNVISRTIVDEDDVDLFDIRGDYEDDTNLIEMMADLIRGNTPQEDDND